jgi:toxin YoeB
VHVQPEPMEDLRHWVEHDRKLAIKVLDLIEGARRDPFFGGIGKPEPLKNLGSDVWSRRITREDRLVYRVSETFIDMLQARYHY